MRVIESREAYAFERHYGGDDELRDRLEATERRAASRGIGIWVDCF